MPIDLRLLTKNDDLWTELEASLKARAVESDPEPELGSRRRDTTPAALHRLRARLEAARAAALRLESYRRRLRAREAGATKDGLKNLKELHQTAQEELQDVLQTVPNYVDWELQHEGYVAELNDPDTVRSSSDTKDAFNQIMFCLGGYDVLGASNVCMLTRIGMELFRAMEERILDCCGSMPSVVRSELHEMPSQLPIPQNTNGSGASVIPVPSWQAFIQQYLSTGRKYFDRQLPQGHLLISRSNNQCINKKQPPAWYETLAVQHRIEVLLVTGPSLAVDSRHLQLEWMRYLRDMYARLAPGSRLRLRTVPAMGLAPAEVSRVVLEGYLPQRREVVTLASLSNLLDYESAGLRHGNSIDKRHLHLLHGSVCDVGCAVEWVLQHAEVAPDRGCVHLPRYLWQQDSTLNLVRRITQKRGGRTFVEDILPAQSETSVPVHGTTGTETPTAAVRFGADHGSCQPTSERIRLEAASCPFDFLPFYCR